MNRPTAQTALSDGFGPALHDFADVVDVASLDHARRRHLRRRAMDAVDHLIALLDALDLATEDREPDDFGEDDGTAEPSLGAPENHPGPRRLDMDGHCRSGRARHPLGDQSQWAAGGSSEGEDDDPAEEDDPGEDNGDLDDDGLSRGEADDADIEATAPERAGRGFVRCGPDDAEDDDPAERGDHYGCESEPHPWRFWPDAWSVQARLRAPASL